ncbi:SDR family NAD(P)-dependent oxidoreductase [Pelosinus fermentans]|uniref:Mycocerosate synthase, 6-deoxyerythronolide-B synthase n=1 Tax=Pelosinus fermentans JBW45 TaxID=1192197 RepID=I8TNB6_9FIRM|nr:SDR family NAD(P)-dependent oxidoreductase [Pelosinus fermentans]AJQ25407.1 Mycocerosate synthase, 6-deoxyerythronolide-B synthase [Pelosinus fermentans JBW45]
MANQAVTAIAQEMLHEKAITYFKKLLSSVIKLPANRIEVDAPMEKYGIDSIMIMQMTNQLETIFGSLPKTLFFEYQNIQEITGYFLESYRDQLIELLGVEEKATETTEKYEYAITEVEPAKSSVSSRRRSFFASQRMKAPQEKSEQDSDIAIIGVSGRYPQAKNIQEFWENLRAGKDCITEIPQDRWDHSLYFDEDKDKPGKTYSKWGGFLDGVDKFDPLFFNISPREAEFIDPQERLFLECAYETLEDAGYTRETIGTHQGFGLEGNVGVFVGVMYDEYQLYGAQEQIQGRPIALAGNSASIANRVSYFCNFHGPSMTVNTMCSSSLIAIHLACQSLQRGECEFAMAGGVNLSIHPNKYLALGQGKFVSSKGRCESFGQGGDGYVPGEGVGAILLKPLSKAIDDGDHIYGVIKGTAINHGGKTNGYTVPNPNAQASVIGRAFKKAGINPRTISYIEAHGTGTSLGDPIETAGLTKTFQEYTKDKQFCAIGSAKSNIGHCESASGIAGVTKVLLQLKYRQLVPSLHSEMLNPNIDFGRTPFVVQQELTEWNRPVIEIDGEIREYPRRAGISSFGAGGSNAHVFIEEYIAKDQPLSTMITARNPAIIALSAKNKKGLKEQAQQLLAVIGEQQFSDKNLADMAYTLQVGREAMEERLAVIVGSVKELEDKLQGFVEGQDDIDDLYRGQVKRDAENMSVFTADEDMKKTMEAWMIKGKYAKIAEIWVKGLIIDWNKLYGNSKPSRISLPTYPFAKERYWVPESNTIPNNKITSSSNVALLHPLLHQNTSDLSEQRFSSIFTGQEFFLADDVVKGQRVLSGAIFLEMARAAVEQGAGVLAEDLIEIRLKNVVLGCPVAVGHQPAQIHIGLYPEENGEIAYEIYSESEDTDAEPIVHSQGIAVLSSLEKVSTMDIKALQAECSQNTLTSSSQNYETFRTAEIEKVYIGSDQVLVKLYLASPVVADQNQFVLHPNVMNVVLQNLVSFMPGTDDFKPVLPIALQELEIIENCAFAMWALIRCSEGMAVGDKERKFDIDLCDEQGNICVRMKGLRTQGIENVVQELLPSPPSMAVPNTQEAFEMMSFEEIWQEQALLTTTPTKIKTLVCFISKPENQQTIMEEIENLDQETKVIYISQGTAFEKQSQQNYSVARTDLSTYKEAFDNIREDYSEVDAMLYLWPIEDSSCIQDYSSLVYILQAIAGSKLNTKRLLLAGQFANRLERCYLESWIGFEISLEFVLPNMQVAAVYKEAYPENKERAIRDWLNTIWTELQADKIQSVLYQGGKRSVHRSQATAMQANSSLLRAGGTYLIVGGCGEIGFLFAKYFAQKHPVNLILTGRSPKNEDKQAKIKILEDLGSQIMYIEADVCDASGMKEGLSRAKERFGKIHGVIHAARIESKQSIFEKDIQGFQQVIAPKITGTLVLDEVLAAEELDFICYFSSSSAILGDFGSCDYAIGNRFQMAYAHYRKEEQRHGKTVVINWPLWKDFGMDADENEHIKMYLKTSGQRFLEAEEGVAIFEHILAQHQTQHLVVVGQRSRVHRFLGLAQNQSASSPQALTSPAVKGRRAEMIGLDAEQCLEWDLKEYVSKLLKISRDKLDREINLVDFGFDSVGLSQFAKLLTSHYGIEISPAIFFGYFTIEKLIQYFITEHQELIQNYYEEDTIQQSISQKVETIAVKPKQHRNKKSRFNRNSASPSGLEPIAIIGMSGRFPDARNIDEMWKIILEGQDVVKENSEDKFWGMGFGSNKWKCGWIPGVKEFDPLFFGIPPREAEMMDPRQRLLLQESWRALEDAGYGKERIKNSTIGMFVGVEDGDYHMLSNEKGSVTSNHNGVLAARLAYFLNLDGPNMAINTACSSGLVAAHQAYQSLRNQECDTAIAAGINLLLTPGVLTAMSQAGMLSEDGKCYAFDKRANGMVPGEAIAVVVLKRLSKAQADGDPIYAVIKGSGINYDGKTNGITVPSGVSQSKLLKSVYDRNKVNPEEIEYIVTHGTGTKLGDPIEINALYDVFKGYTKKQSYCALTSVKTNFGHTMAASGLVSLISMVQALRYETIPASLHCEQENDYINWQESPFYVNKTNKIWSKDNGKQRSGSISAFGLSGTNVHMIVQSYSEAENTASLEQMPYYLLAFSAKTKEALQEKIQDMIDVLQKKDAQEASLAELSYTLLQGRQHFNHRCVVVVQGREDAIYALQQVNGKERLPNLFHGKVSREFTRQKAIEQYAQELLENSRSFRENKRKYQETLYALAEFYCQGYEINGDMFYGDRKPRRISLPTYPFARTHYWVPEIDTKHADHITSQSVAEFIPSQNTEKVILEKGWQEKAIHLKAEIQTGIVVVLGTVNTMKIASALFADTEDIQVIQVIQVIHGSNPILEGISTDFYSISAGESLYQQMKDKQGEQKLIGVIDITAYDEMYEQSAAVESGKITFLQRLIAQDRSQGYKLLQVTHQLHSFQLAETKMQGARLAGLYRMLGSEYKQIQSMTMDSDYLIHKYQQLAQQIETEFWNIGDENLSECCYRKGKRNEPQLTISQSNDDIQEKLPISKKYEQQDVVLITGGTRGIGAVIAKHVVSQGVKNLVIMGREELPKPNEWNQYLKNKEKPEVEEKLRRMQSFIDQGVKVNYFNTSLTDQDGINNMVHKVNQDLGPITGVFHCAGVINKNPAFIKKSIADMEAVCEPKMKGLVTLHKALENEPLAFFILFSSISSVVPTLSAGASDYAMANNYMDYYAQYQIGQGKSYFKSIQWPAWGETGMTKGGLRTPAYMKTGLVSITTADGLTFLDIIESTSQIVNLPCVVVPGEFMHNQLLKPTITVEKKEAGLPSRRTSTLKQKTENTQGVQANLRASILKWLQKIFMDEFKFSMDQLHEDIPFDEYGVDSMMLAELAQKMQMSISEPLNPSLLLENSTLALLTDYFMDNHFEDLQEQFGSETSNTIHVSSKENSISMKAEPLQIISIESKDDNRNVSDNQSTITNETLSLKEDIAVVGIACRFPGASTKEAYWELLNKGLSAIEPVPKKRWSPKDERMDYGGWIDDIDLFDPKFFNIKELDAAIMDPQARILLEESLQAIYDAGYEHKQLSGEKIGVYIGGRSHANTNVNAVLQAPNPILGIGQNYMATNISRFFNFKGPSLVVDTACSSGITSLLFAADSLREKRINMALVGAVNLLLNSSVHDMFAARNILSKDGEFHIFDKRSRGEVLGEGAGVVMLKRLSDAIKDGNHIYGVIKAVSVNNDGRTLGPGSPNINAQKEVMREALVLSGKQPDDIGYIEANGGGTAVVDSVEIKALSEVYCLDNQELAACAIGSIKPNVGHLLFASGMAGFIRCVLSVYHKQIPPFLSATEPFPHYNFNKSRVQFNRQTIQWDVAEGKKRVAAQNSMPDGGTNCHVVIEEFVPENMSYHPIYRPKIAPTMIKKALSSVEKNLTEQKQQEPKIVRNKWGEYSVSGK